MSSLTGFVKRIRDIMWNDAGVNGDAQRIEQMAWILFLESLQYKGRGMAIYRSALYINYSRRMPLE